MNKKIVGIVLAVMLSMILIESYLLFNQPKQTVSDIENILDSTSKAPASLGNETVDSQSPTGTSNPGGTSTKLSNETTSDVVFESISFPKLPVPEFTLQYADHSYDVPATYKFNEYTGQMVVDKAGYRVTDFTIDITIKNQPFSCSFNGVTYNLYYSIRTKGHFGENWYHVSVFNRTKSINPYETAKYVYGPIQSNTEYTVLHYTAEYFSKGDQVDIQVQAVIGHAGLAFVNDSPFIAGIGYYEPAVLVDAEGDWSSTKTVTIDNATLLAPIEP